MMGIVASFAIYVRLFGAAFDGVCGGRQNGASAESEKFSA